MTDDYIKRLIAEDGLLPFYDAGGRQRGFVHPDYVDNLVPPFTTKVPAWVPACHTFT